jgi:hypothetical protein
VYIILSFFQNVAGNIWKRSLSVKGKRRVMGSGLKVHPPSLAAMAGQEAQGKMGITM